MKVSSIVFCFVSSMMFGNVVTATTNDDTVPFYLKVNEMNPNQVIAVVYYGELGDTSKEIEVPCSMNQHGSNMTNYGGPNTITCECYSTKRGCGSNLLVGSNSSHQDMIGKSKCQLTVPFTFVRDENGTITSVNFNITSSTSNTTNDVLVVPFYPKKNNNGDIVAVLVTNNSDDSNNSMLTPFVIGMIVILGVIVGAIMITTLPKRCVTRTTKTNLPTMSTERKPITTSNSRNTTTDDGDTTSMESGSIIYNEQDLK